jgi:hypothetical protein
MLYVDDNKMKYIKWIGEFFVPDKFTIKALLWLFALPFLFIGFMFFGWWILLVVVIIWILVDNFLHG